MAQTCSQQLGNQKQGHGVHRLQSLDPPHGHMMSQSPIPHALGQVDLELEYVEQSPSQPPQVTATAMDVKKEIIHSKQKTFSKEEVLELMKQMNNNNISTTTLSKSSSVPSSDTKHKDPTLTTVTETPTLQSSVSSPGGSSTSESGSVASAPVKKTKYGGVPDWRKNLKKKKKIAAAAALADDDSKIGTDESGGKVKKKKKKVIVADKDVPPCTLCDCVTFTKNPFKKGQCNSCFHIH